MERSAFLAGTVGLATASLLSAIATANPAPLKLGESARFPGWVLKCYRDTHEHTEIYLAYSRESLAKMDFKCSPDDFEELAADHVVTNMSSERCNGRCGAADHDCFVVRDAIAQQTAS